MKISKWWFNNWFEVNAGKVLNFIIDILVAVGILEEERV